MLKIQNLSASYHNRQVLHDVSFDVKNGEVLALIGPNGAGKSTIIHAASGGSFHRKHPHQRR
ncbi:MAG: ATP-binding cassette domain-containing protein [Anaerolineales bacterium]|uniref:ATP-binding cassette domain-containing protein n=1 Tax=Candidatus Villigracilis proximus TaxID=3140683 RepID=UPI0031348893|nr:ATP-binding cassette domain-containing protein [Anaerolineales bacterium]